jgi:ferredoxin
LFTQDEEGLVVARMHNPQPRDHEDARKAAAACPVGAIELEEDQDG